MLRLTGRGANCLERWLDDEAGRRQRWYQTHDFRGTADRVAVFLAAVRLLGSAFCFVADRDRVALIVCGSQGANWSPGLRPPFFLNSTSSSPLCSTEMLA